MQDLQASVSLIYMKGHILLCSRLAALHSYRGVWALLFVLKLVGNSWAAGCSGTFKVDLCLVDGIVRILLVRREGKRNNESGYAGGAVPYRAVPCRDVSCRATLFSPSGRACMDRWADRPNHIGVG